MGVVRHSNIKQRMSALGHSRPSHFVPVLNNVRYASDSDHSRYESELTLWANIGLMHTAANGTIIRSPRWRRQGTSAGALGAPSDTYSYFGKFKREFRRSREIDAWTASRRSCASIGPIIQLRSETTGVRSTMRSGTIGQTSDLAIGCS